MKRILLSLIIVVCCTAMLKSQEEYAQWLRYPAISPDGQAICFAARGDLYLVDVKGGVAIPLTLHKSYDYMPVWSPDGKTIVFASDRNGNFDLYSIGVESGSPKRLTFYSGSELPWSFSPDGQEVLFSAGIEDSPDNILFPSGALNELYSVSLADSSVKRLITSPAEHAAYSKDGKSIIYQNRKGYEDQWRKHHTSSVTRDIRKYDMESGKHSFITNFAGEDRDPVIVGDKLYYLSEENGSMNVWMMTLDNPKDKQQVTFFEQHPVRFLSAADQGTLCFGYNGAIYTMKAGAKMPEKLNVNLRLLDQDNQIVFKKHSDGSREMVVSPNGKEVAFIVRGDVFVTSSDYATTKQITQTAGQERSVSFSPDGRSLLYAAERDTSWNIYQTSIVLDNEPRFSSATLLEEKPLIVNEKDCFQPKFSPDGKEVAYLEERTTLRVFNMDDKKSRTVMNGDMNYSYSDGDQWFDWSPDGKWLLSEFSPNHLFQVDVALIKADGNGEPYNLTQSGYHDSHPRWTKDGKAMLWFSDREGMRSHGSWGSTRDAYIMFFEPEAWKNFNMTKEERELLKEEKKKEQKPDEDKKDKKKKKEEKEVKKDSLEVQICYNGMRDRVKRLTINSSNLSDALLSPDGTKLYYLARFEKGYDLWEHDLLKNETKLLLKFSGGGGAMQFDKEGKNLFLYSSGSIYKIPVSGGKPTKKVVSFNAEQKLDLAGERAYMFEHAWRQCLKKFYDTAMHQVDWDFYGDNYRQFLPFINNNYDFAEMMSEMLGELNASHTGSGYRHSASDGDRTASLGIISDFNFEGPGIKVEEVIAEGPLDYQENVKKGTLIKSIDGTAIQDYAHFLRLMNHQKDKKILLVIENNGKTDSLTLKPISKGSENGLLYKRWIKRERALCDSLSGGRIGYVHVAGMNSSSFRQFYSDVLGLNSDKDAIIVDTRFNGGGWLHDDLVTLLSGKPYVQFAPRGQKYGYDPMTKWNKPSAVLISEGNYSDAHGFPYAYKTLEIGKLVGMPVAGTMTAVWWETLQDPSLYFGIPQVGALDMNDNYLENQQLEPDVKVDIEYDVAAKGFDQQLAKAVKVLLQEIEQKK